MRKLTVFVLFLSLLSALEVEATSSVSTSLPSVIPLPQMMQLQAGPSLTIKNGATVFAPTPEAAWAADYMADFVSRTNGLKLKVKTTANANRPSIQFLKVTDEAAQPEAYTISISAKEGAIVRATARAGLYYGAVTLYQLLTSDPNPEHVGVLPALIIHDQPALAYRGFLLDSGRHMQPVSYIYHLLDVMGLHKLNRLHWHLTEDQGWRIEIKKYPRLTTVGSISVDPETGRTHGGFYTQDEVRKIVRYAQERNIDIIPEFELPGHATAAVVSYPEISAAPDHPPKQIKDDYGILPYLMNPASPKTYEFIHGVLDELMDLFPGQTIHLGGDEAMKDEWKANPEIQALKKKLGLRNETALQDWFMSEIGKYVEARGRTAMAYYYPGARPVRRSMPVEVYLPSNPVKTLLSQGYTIINLMWPEMYFNESLSDQFPDEPGVEGVNPLPQVYGFDPYIEDLTAQEKSRVLGLEGALWTEDVDSTEVADALTFPRELAVAEIGWTLKSRRSWPDFVRRLVSEYDRFQKLGLIMSDIPYRPVVKQRAALLSSGLRVRASNQTHYGTFRYTTNGKDPNADSPELKGNVKFQPKMHLKIATFTPDGVKISKSVEFTTK